MQARWSKRASPTKSCCARRTRVRHRSCRASIARSAIARLKRRSSAMFPAKQDVTICFAHAAYQMKARFDLRKTGIKSFQVWAHDELLKRVGEADVVVVSGMWKNELIPGAAKLKFIQSISSGMDQYSKEQLAAKSVRLCSAAGVNT